MKCQKCQSERIASLDCKHDDRFSLYCEADDVDIQADYAPRIEDLCGGDNTRFRVCLDCGQMQGKFPKEKMEARC